jgi:class 3 adenylate cyclase
MTHTADDHAVSLTSVDEWHHAGLYDPDDPKAAERLELLAYLAGLGATTADMVDADARGQLVELSSEILHHGAARLSLRELASRHTDGDVEPFLELFRSVGLTIEDLDEPAFRAGDAVTLDVMADSLPIFGAEAMRQFGRVIGASMAAIADAAMASFGSSVASRFEAEGASELEIAKTIEIACDLLFNRGPIAFEMIFYHHARAALRRANATGISRGGVAGLAVAFVDLVGSTALAQQLEPAQFGATMSTFEQRAVELSAAAGGRVVKTIGDEVMIVATDAATLCDVACGLRSYAREHALLPPVRGAVASGEMTASFGDYYGMPVNLAARMVKIARPHDILVTAETATELAANGAPHAPTSIGRHVLRGFHEPIELYRLEPSA